MGKELFPQRGGNPCHGCADRHTACSDHCKKPEFLAWRAEQEKIKENRHNYYGMADYFREKVDKNRRKR